MKTTKPSIGLSQQLEVLNFNTLSEHSINLNRSDGKPLKSSRRRNFRGGLFRKIQNKISTDILQDDKTPVTCQYELFQKAMWLLLVSGQCIGLNPVSGIMNRDASKMRFTVLSWRFLYGLLLALAQAMATVLCLYQLLNGSVNIIALAFMAFYLSASCNTFIFLRVASKWPSLMNDVYKSGLDNYIDVEVIKRSFVACLTFFSCSMIEHMLSLLSKIVQTADCLPNNTEISQSYIVNNFPWVFALNVPYYLPLGLFLQLLNLISTINWSYSDVFIVCMSLYLISILEQINEKIEAAADYSYLPNSFWCNLREDYTKATRLVHIFDNAISSVIFSSFATNLFFICLQLYNILSNGIVSRNKIIKELCPNYPTGPLGGYEHIVYLLFSLSFLLGRSLVVSLVAAKVHSASTVPAPALYNIPQNMYCAEVQRFLDQVHGDKVALSGLQFFNVTRELVLSVAGTIVTYELVLLQFSGDDLTINN